MKKILVIEDDEAIRLNILDLLEAEGFAGVGAADGELGVEAAFREAPDVIICDIMMPALDGFGVLEKVRGDPRLAATPFIFLTAKAERADIRAGMTHDADDYLTKPFSRVELLDAIVARLKRQEAVAQRLTPRVGGGGAESNRVDGARLSKRRAAMHVVVHAEAMRALYEEAFRAALTSISVLLLGETGVGKDVLAYEIHRRSPRNHGPFLPLNCAALSPSLLESELFGHEKGAFTGAAQMQPGLFETAHGGTIFLDEIGELDPSIQVKLLRVLEDRIVTRVGSRKSREVDVRFICATNRDLDERVRTGQFRQDLFFRINGITLDIPPLRQRQVEIVPLAKQFAAAACNSVKRPPLSMHPDTIERLERYQWPGNVRELKNVIDRAVVLCRETELQPTHLPENVRSQNRDAAHNANARGAGGLTPMDELRGEVADLERQRIVSALEQCGGNQTKAAAQLGISRRTLVSRLDAYDLPRPRKNR